MVIVTLWASNQRSYIVWTEIIQQGRFTAQLSVKTKNLAINFDFLADLCPVNHGILVF